jgi:hypothetical protein
MENHSGHKHQTKYNIKQMNKQPCKKVESMVKVIATSNLHLISNKRKEGWKLPDI